ncbi:MAG: YggS family pyridoxal phosphate enzyme [Solirubrobacteraceae bacterium]
MVDLIGDLQAATVRANLGRVRAEIAAAGRPQDTVQILAAVKYVPVDALGELAQTGLTLLGENRAQDLVAKATAYPGVFTWDFIGALQSRKVAQIVPHVRYIQSVASDSAMAQLARHATAGTRIMIEVNVAGDGGKSGIAPAELDGFLERSPVPVVGLMTMPPQVDRAELNRRHFAALRELAERHDLRELSMGTSQDYLVAVQEGATIIRLGRSLYFQSAS